MKEAFAVILALALMVSLCACSGQAATKLGFASKTIMSRSSDLADNGGVKTGTTLADTLMCSVVVDGAGK
jgi:hypothetical protein